MLQVSDFLGVVHIVQLVHTLYPHLFRFEDFPPSLWTMWTI
jgi:hypothetical protein